MLIYYSL